MPLSDPDLFTREEALAGLPARRAQTALFLLESRTAHLVARSRQALEPFLGETTAAERDLAFVEAFTLGKAPPLRPTIQNLEQYALQWRALAPDNPPRARPSPRSWGRSISSPRLPCRASARRWDWTSR